MKNLMKCFVILISIIILVFIFTNFISETEPHEVVESPKVRYRFCPNGSRGKCYLTE